MHAATAARMMAARPAAGSLLGFLRPGAVAAATLFPARRSYAAGGNVALIKDLREKTGAPMMDVKKALAECEWDMDLAFEALRKRGLAAASKKASRTASEGLVGVAIAEGAGAVVEINSETDFVARNDQFQAMIGDVAAAVLKAKPPAPADGWEVPYAAFAALPVGAGTAEEAVADVAGVVRENIKLRRAFLLSAQNGVVSSYLHTSPGPGLGRMAALVALEAEGGCGGPQVDELGYKIAMHVVAARPAYLARGDVPQEALENEKRILREQALASGKPEKIVDKMVLGRLGKFYEEQCLLDQKYVMDDAVTVGKVVEAAGKELGKKLKVTGFVRVQVGEGIEVEESDFAAEVKSLSGA